MRCCVPFSMILTRFAVLVAPGFIATGCFLAGDYVTEESAAVSPATDGTVEATMVVCAADEHRSPDGVCYWLNDEAVTWFVASSACTAHGAGWTLVTVRSAAEHAFITSLVQSNTWLGASDAEPSNSWRWVGETEPFFVGTADQGVAAPDTYVRWSSGEPSAHEDGACARYTAEMGEWYWASTSCADSHRALCELRP